MATLAISAVSFDIDSFIEQENRKDLLRFTTAGSVDDGKSTLIGRLLFDSRNVYEDQIKAVTRASLNRGSGHPDLSLLTDGLRAEREQGITIDVAYRYFNTSRRKFILADTPGHEQYTRNMVTGASSADLAIILVDARKGIQPQSRRHSYVASLLGIRYFVVAINKMDLVDYEEQVFLDIKAEFQKMLAGLRVQNVYFVPISALVGDNVVDASSNMPWFRGPSLLEYLETVETTDSRWEQPFRFPVQRVIRPHQDHRAYAGRISSGIVRPGDEVLVLPSGRRTRVADVVSYDGDLEAAWPSMSVSLTLEDEIDISRGDLICSAELKSPKTSSRFASTLVWFNEFPLRTDKSYLLKHASRTVRAEVKTVRNRLNINTFERELTTTLHLNEIGVAEIETSSPLYFDPYRENPITGSLILIDPATNATVAAGMILDEGDGMNQSKEQYREVPQVITRAASPVTATERLERYGNIGAAVNLQRRLEVAYRLERILFDQGAAVVVLKDATSQVVATFANSGLIALNVGAADFEGMLHPALLPEDDEEAAMSVYDLLLRTKVLTARNGS
ncbi:MAG TPA: sulfate adenylyltransferase subunit CysN [Candidatus Angelobacter sp.]|jgi:sulfate adenylyltransferase large subunit|nr:sulfate adenylyltransferase subunit CysN [Candidatus Angelobacter sp.]